MKKSTLQTDEFLNDIEIEAVKRFVNDKIMKEAVRKILLRPIYAQGVLVAGETANPSKNAFLFLLAGQGGSKRHVSNEQLGSEFRAMEEGVNFLQEGFQKLETYNKGVGDKPSEEESGE